MAAERMDLDSPSYTARRGALEEYFDRTAAETWRQLTSDAPVSKIRATVRAGRDRMRALLLSRLPRDLSGQRVLDAGCGTGAGAIALAERGAEVVAVDLAANLVAVARERTPEILRTHIDYRDGDMLADSLGHFDHLIAMDSLIHYETPDMLAALARILPRIRRSAAITFAPRTPALSLMHAVGTLFPRGDRAPAIVPVSEAALRRKLLQHPKLEGWRVAHSERVSSGFYMSHALELSR